MAENKIGFGAMEGYREDYPRTLEVPPGCRPASREALSAFVPGRPAPQGSKRYVGKSKKGTAILIEQNKSVKPWRELVTTVFKARPYGASVLTSYPTGTALVVMIVFVMPRPVATPKRKPTPAHTHAPDVDKLVRAVLDGITDARNVWADDGQVVTVHAHKRVAELGETTGAMIHIQPVPDPLGPRGVGCYPPADVSSFDQPPVLP